MGVAEYKEDGNNDIRPNTITYNSAMDAYARQGDVDGTKRVLAMMKEDYNSGNKNAKPDINTYTILIAAWSKSKNKNSPVEVEKILKVINDLHKSGKLKEGPNKITYNTMIKCFGIYPGTEERIEEIKMLMKTV